MKIFIVGAGPIGCYTAQLLKEKNKVLDITIIEEHAEIGRPIHCAGLVSVDVLNQIKIPFNDKVVINHIDGAEFNFAGDSFKINRKNVALVIDREKFDRALGMGLKVNFDTKFMGIEKEDRGYLVETDKGEYYADIVIGADGANSSLRRIAGFDENITYLRGAQFRMKYDKCQRNFVQVYLKNPSFAWVIPEEEGIVRVGIISDNPYHDLTQFLKESSMEGEILEKFAGVVPLGRCISSKQNIFLVGDAACQVKPLTHGGIYYGMRCAEMLVDCIINNHLSDYEKLWQSKFGREIQVGLKVRQIYQHLSDDNMVRIFNLLKNNVELLERFGDLENHSKVISAIIKDHHLQSFLGKILINIIKDTQI